MGVLYAVVQEVEKPEICCHWESVRDGEEAAIDKERRFAMTRHDRSASSGRRRIALSWTEEARRRNLASRCDESCRPCPVLGRAIGILSLRLLHARSGNILDMGWRGEQAEGKQK
jgi:hypothetical protein